DWRSLHVGRAQPTHQLPRDREKKFRERNEGWELRPPTRAGGAARRRAERRKLSERPLSICGAGWGKGVTKRPPTSRGLSRELLLMRHQSSGPIPRKRQ